MRKYILQISIAVAAILLLATIAVGITGFRTAKEVAQTSPLLSYNLQGNFSHQAYGYRSTGTLCATCGETELVYFPKIIDSVTGSYTYELISKETVSDVKAQVQISVTLSWLGYWSKQMEVLPAQELSGNKITFPLDINGYMELAQTIADELGFKEVSSIDMVLTAAVHTEANVGGAVIAEDFVQTSTATISDLTLKWQIPLDLAAKGYQANKAYEQRGLFGYAIALLPNTLMGEVTLTSPSPAVKILHKLDLSDGYQPDEIANMNIDFVYNLAGDNPVSGVVHEVSASAILSNIDGEQVLFPLLAKQQFTEDFSVRLPIDVTLLYDVINQMENTTDNAFDAKYNLMIKVDVHTTATEPGTINENLSAILPLTLSSSNLAVGDVTGNAKTGSLTRTELIPNETRSTILMLSLSLLCLTVIAGLWVAWNFWERHHRPSQIYALWDDTRAAMEKNKDIMVNVTELPATTEAEKVTRLASLSELVKLADSLLKPVLHVNDTERHTFCVIDGAARYEYFIIEPPSNK
jgi:hypothetical protein